MGQGRHLSLSIRVSGIICYPSRSLALVEAQRVFPDALAGLVEADPQRGVVLELPAAFARVDHLVEARANLRRARHETAARRVAVIPGARARPQRARQLAET